MKSPWVLVVEISRGIETPTFSFHILNISCNNFNGELQNNKHCINTGYFVSGIEKI
jgi:hypothetical protein